MRVSYLLAVLLSMVIMNANAWGYTYTVKKGDSLYKISKIYKMRIQDIRRANNIETDKIFPGMELTIPEKEQQTAYIPVVADDNTPAKNKAYVTSAINTTQPDIKTVPMVIRDESASKYAEELREISMSAESDYSGTKEFLISIAERTLGVPYKFGGNSFKATDCSGYVKLVFNLIGIELPRSAREQFKVGQSIDRQDLSMGDLVFFQTYAPFPSHVGIYLGNNLFIHASSFAKKVTINSLNAYYLKRFIGAKRVEGLNDRDSLNSLDNYVTPE